MSQIHTIRRFRINPVEVVIFLMISTIFIHSLYKLFYNYDAFNPIALVPLNSNPISEGRSLASVTPVLLNVDIPCDKPVTITSQASRVRLHGQLCGVNPNEGASKLAKMTIINSANQFNATVFTDVYNEKFSTDYIPLNTGINSIQLNFSYLDKKPVSQEIILNNTQL